jgi:hypothetical protein
MVSPSLDNSWPLNFGYYLSAMEVSVISTLSLPVQTLILLMITFFLIFMKISTEISDDVTGCVPHLVLVRGLRAFFSEQLYFGQELRDSALDIKRLATMTITRKLAQSRWILFARKDQIYAPHHQKLLSINLMFLFLLLLFSELLLFVTSADAALQLAGVNLAGKSLLDLILFRKGEAPCRSMMTPCLRAGAEFGEGNLPGTYNRDYTYPGSTEVDYYVSKGNE